MKRSIAAQFMATAAALALQTAACFAGSDTPAPKPMKVWNLTAATIVDFRLAPSGASTFGANLTLDDKDKTIDIDERLTLRDIAPGVYDARITFRNGRACRVNGLKLAAGEITSVEEKDLLAKDGLGGCLR
jgi:hypothetical protein